MRPESKNPLLLSLLAGALSLLGCTHAKKPTPAAGFTCVNGLCYQSLGGMAVFQGDVILDNGSGTLDAQVASRLAVSAPSSATWPGGVIPYTRDPSLSSSLAIDTAIAQFNATSGLRVIPRTSEADYLTFTSSPIGGCYSNVGRQGGQQFTRLAYPDCAAGDILHELGHVAGLWHEHSRSDRDQYITLHTENIDPFFLVQFQIQNGTILGPYDYHSIMHYPSKAYSRNGKPTITKADGSTDPQMGQRDALSPGDQAALAALYGLGKLDLDFTESSPFVFAPTVVNAALDHTFTVKNTGQRSITSMAVTTALSAPFSFKDGSYPGTGGTCGTSVNPGGSCTLVVTFTPSATTSYESSLAVSYISGGASQTVTEKLKGIGEPFACDSGSAGAACTIASPKTLGNGQTLSVAGDLTLANAGQIVTVAGASGTIAINGKLLVQNGGSLGGNFTISAASLTVDSGGTIGADGKGYAGGNLGAGAGPGGGSGSAAGCSNVVAPGGAGGGFGGTGGFGSNEPVHGIPSPLGGNSYGSASKPTDLGSGGGGSATSAGGAGGGSLQFQVRGALVNNGTISANGAAGANKTNWTCPGGGGGSGGSIQVHAGSLGGTGSFSANGGTGGTGGGGGSGGNGGGGGGSGGRIALYGDTPFVGQISAAPGIGDLGKAAGSGGYGTYFQSIKNLCTSGTVNDTCVISQSTPLGIGDTLSGTGSLTIAAGGVLYNPVPAFAVNGLTLSFSAGAISVQSGGTIHANASLASASLLVSAGGILSADGMGSQSAYQGNGGGLGGGGGANQDPSNAGAPGGGGGGYGGSGGAGANGAHPGGTAGPANSTPSQPPAYGSGGGGGAASFGGGGGGGFSFTISGAAQVDGTVSANGAAGSPPNDWTCSGGGGGSGGFISGSFGSLAGAGTFSVNGGDGGKGNAPSGGGGGGGIVTLSSPSVTFPAGSAIANGGIGGASTAANSVPSANGNAGTVSVGP